MDSITSVVKFPVSFVSRADGRQVRGLYSNDFQLVGSGHVSRWENRLIVMGRRQIWPFGASVPSERHLMLSEIASIGRAGRLITFETKSGWLTHRYLRLWFAEEVTAGRFLAEIRSSVSLQTRMVETEFEPGEALTRTTPAVTYGLALACVATFIAALATGQGGWTREAGGSQILFGSNFGPYTTGGEWWRLGTAALIHFGISHLALNVAALLLFATIGERIWGSGRHIILVLTCAVIGNLVGTWSHPDLNAGGISSVVFGVLGALFGAGAFSSDTSFRDTLRPLRWPALIWAIILFTMGSGDTKTDTAAHVGGLVAGCLIGATFTHAKGPSIALPILLIALVPAIALWALSDASLRLTPESRFLQLTREIERDEPAAIAAWVAIVESARSGSQGDFEIAERLEREVLPFWIDAHKRLTEIELDPDSAPRSQYDYLVELTSRRRSAIELCRQGFRSHDSSMVTRCSRQMGQIDRFIERQGFVGE